MTKDYSPTVDTARSYYNSNDADTFYFTIWGGEDIHIGLYNGKNDIFQASRATVDRMRSRLERLKPGAKVLDLGSGYAGAARILARNDRCEVVALNLSEEQNERGRKLNREQGLDDLIEVVDGSFEKLPYEDETFDVVWSQDAFLHSGERMQVMQEAARVLRPGGELIFTDPMQTDDCPDGVLDPILERIHLETLGSPEFYRSAADSLGLQEVDFEDHTDQLVNHYSNVLQETMSREDELSREVSQDYIDRMKKGLAHWVAGGEHGYLTWGIFHFKKN